MATITLGEENTTEKEIGAGDPVGIQCSPALVRESVIVFDWDDTILPTSWLERIRALTAGVPLRPEVQRQMATLASLCATTMSMAQQMGTVVFITNSAPGWIDQSCQLFLPQIYQQVRSYPIFAKPMHAPLTFKLSAFRRECQAFRNLVSVGDGDAERAASLRLLTPPAGKMGVRGDPADLNKLVKSVKLIEFPSCQQLIAQHEMLQVRLMDIVSFQGSLDLKARFSGAAGFGSPTSQGRATSTCTLVHFGRPIGGPVPMSPPQRSAQSASLPVRPPMEDGGTAASNKMQQGLMMFRSPTTGVRAPSPGGLPPLGGKLPGSSDALDYSSAAASIVGRSNSASRGREVANASDSRNAVPASGELMPTAAEAAGGAVSGASGSPIEDINSDTRADRDTTPTRMNAQWKMQGLGDPHRGRAQYQTPTKKRPVLPSSPGGLTSLRAGRSAVGSAVWREGSAPAATRGGM